MKNAIALTAASAPAADHIPPPLDDPLITPDATQDEPEEPMCVNTEPNRFGVYRQYTVFPKVDPETNRAMDCFVDSPCLKKTPTNIENHGVCQGLKGIGINVSRGFKDNIYTPLKNFTTFLLMSWFYNGSTTKTVADFNILVNDVMQHPLFHIPDLKGFDAVQELDKLDNYDPTSETLTAEDGWKSSTVKIPVPKEGHSYPSEEDALTFEVSGLHHRSLLDIVIETAQDPAAKTFHFIPHKLFWLRPSKDLSKSLTSTSPSSHSRKATVEDVPNEDDNAQGDPSALNSSSTIPSASRLSSSNIPTSKNPLAASQRTLRSAQLNSAVEDNSESRSTMSTLTSDNETNPERIYSEIYNSDAMIEEHTKINSQARDPDDPDDLEYVVAPLIAYTDSTRLANFGGASLWPGYLFFGWQTKYERCKPSCFAAHHFAYFPTVSIFSLLILHSGNDSILHHDFTYHCHRSKISCSSPTRFKTGTNRFLAFLLPRKSCDFARPH